ncbi:MAG: aminopeptidase [Deltaproteobacteria bacterium]|nr:aminopeptidase [Deltaproteobacteria bacterium]
MLTDEQIERYADVLLWALKVARRGRFHSRDIVLLQYDRQALPLAEILYERILSLNMNPVQRMISTAVMEQSFFERSKGRQLAFLVPGDRELYGSLNGRIYLRAPDSLTHLRHVEPTRIGKALLARKPLRDIMDKREDAGVYGWTLCTLPTGELAGQARLSLDEYTNQIVKACYLDEADPVGRWKAIRAEVLRLRRWLDGLPIRQLHIESNNVDLKITPGEGRRWIGVSGHNIPSFEIFTSPDWRGTEGRYFANLPSFRNGNYVEGVRLTFERGKAVGIEAESGGEFAAKQIAMDGGACRLGEFSLTDRRFSRIDRFMADTLFDENHGGQFGNCHIALGSSYTATFAGDPETLTKQAKRKLGFNDSALHWDLVNTENKRVTARLAKGGTVVIYEGGAFAR